MFRLYHTPEQHVFTLWIVPGKLGWICFEVIYHWPPKVGIMAWRLGWQSNWFWLPGRE